MNALDPALLEKPAPRARGLVAPPVGNDNAADDRRGVRMVHENVAAAVDFESVVRAVLVVDVVESVRLMQEDEAGTVRRWRGYADEAAARVIPEQGGRLIKSLGDGLMVEFPSAPAAVGAAFALQRLGARLNEPLADALKLHLRIGIHLSPLIVGGDDIYGHGVNLAARLTTLAGPDEIVVSAEVRDQLTPALDADIEDLGECFLKHVQKPVRAFRIGTPGDRPIIEPGSAGPDLRATIAVIPFTPRIAGARDDLLGQIVADEVISALSRSPELNVVSRLSTTRLRTRATQLTEASVFLGADYVASGSYHVDGDHLGLHVELAETRTMQVAWSKTLKASVKGVIAGDDPLSGRLVAEICAAMMTRELQRTQGKAIPTLESHTLLLSSITLMHRISPLATERAHQMLTALIERAPRLAAPYAWLAKWHVLQVTQGWSADVQRDGQHALDNTKRALDKDASSSLAMTVEGQVNTHILKRLDIGEQRYTEALQSNPNDSLAWLLKGTLHAFRDEGKEAVRHTRRALKLSPIDPLQFYFEAHAASALLCTEQYDKARALARRSLRLNLTHTSTIRVLVTACWNLGFVEEARDYVKQHMKVDPSFRVSTYLDRSPSAGSALGKRIATALLEAGAPS